MKKFFATLVELVKWRKKNVPGLFLSAARATMSLWVGNVGLELKNHLICEFLCLLDEGLSLVWGFFWVCTQGWIQYIRGTQRLCPAEILQCQHAAKLSKTKPGLPARLLLQNIYCCGDKTKLLAPQEIIL